MDDVTLTFSPEAFMKGIDAINSGIDKMNENFDSFSNQGSKKVQKVAMSSFSLVKALAPIGIAFAGIRKTMNQIPELGKTFSIAGDIISRQLLWPLRRELIPLLRKFLDWVRNNRSMFLRWGSTIVNVFRVIKGIVSGVWNFVKTLWQTFSGQFESIFGRTTKSINDLVNLTLFKISAMTQFIMAMIEPLGKFFGNIIATMVKSIKTFLIAFADGVGDIGPELELVMSWLKELVSLISDANTHTGILTKTFKVLGSTLGLVVGTVLRTLVQTIDTLLLSIQKIPLVVKMFQAWRVGGKENLLELKKLKVELDTLDKNYEERSKDRMKRTLDSVKDYGIGIRNIFKRNPNSEIKNTKISNVTNNTERRFSKIQSIQSTNSRSVKNSRITNDNRMTNNIEIKVEGSTDPKEVAKEVNQSVRDILKEQKFKSGSR